MNEATREILHADRIGIGSGEGRHDRTTIDRSGTVGAGRMERL